MILELIKNFFEKPILIVICEPKTQFLERMLFQILLKIKMITKKVKIVTQNVSFFLSHFEEFKQFPTVFLVLGWEIPANETKKIFLLLERTKNFKLIINADRFANFLPKKKLPFECATYGISTESDFKASYLTLNHGINFKLEYSAKILPIWIENCFGTEIIYSALVTLALGNFLGLNLIELSQKLSKFSPPVGRMRLVEGINGSFIFDNSRCKLREEFLEAIEIFLKLSSFKRKFLVLGLNEKIYYLKPEEVLRIVFGPEIEKKKFIEKLKEKEFQNFQIFNSQEEFENQIKPNLREKDLILINGLNFPRLIQLVDRLRKIW
ncbi:hypothetical protein H5T58_02585 [Candidatus Parcubacteria bacterium]|nr:hypothetical protein [Candidatus Parcubacteria bacterium]